MKVMRSSFWGKPGERDGLRFERNGDVAVLSLARPTARNALTAAGHETLVEAWTDAQHDPTIRALVVTGDDDPELPDEKQSFCAGFDLGDMKSGTVPGGTGSIPSLGAIERLKPTIAAVNGYCIGAGLAILLATDLRLASPTSSFGLPELELGTVPGNGGVRQAAMELPRPAFMELLLLPGRIDADRGLSLGLIGTIVPRNDLFATALSWAKTVAALDRESVSTVLELVALTPTLAPREAAKLESDSIKRLAARRPG